MAFIILSGERATLSPARNAVRTDELHSKLAEIAIEMHPVLGSYLGKAEKSFMVTLTERDEYDDIRRLAFDQFDQESVLLVSDSGDASLIFADSAVVSIGQWTYAGQKAPDVDGWTLIGGLYFHCVSDAGTYGGEV